MLLLRKRDHYYIYPTILGHLNVKHKSINGKCQILSHGKKVSTSRLYLLHTVAPTDAQIHAAQAHICVTTYSCIVRKAPHSAQPWVSVLHVWVSERYKRPRPLTLFQVFMHKHRASHVSTVRVCLSVSVCEACNPTPANLSVRQINEAPRRSLWARPPLEAAADLKKCLGNTFRHIYYDKMVSGCDASSPSPGPVSYAP